MTYRVVAHLRAVEGRGAELGEVLRRTVGPTRAESGTIRYELLVRLDDDRDYTFVEEYQDRDAFDAHMQMPHVVAAQAAGAELLDGGLDSIDFRDYRLVE